MNIMRFIIPIVIAAFGIFLFVYGGHDDSPGAQGLGLIIAVYGVVRLIRKPKGI